MFEPKTYHDKCAHLQQLLLGELIHTLPEEQLAQIAPTYAKVMQANLRLKIVHAEDVLGAVTIPAGERAQLNWVRRLLTANLGKPFFNKQLAGASHEGALGTKSHGTKWKTLLEQLPELYDDMRNGALANGFYVDRSVQVVRGDLPIPYLVIKTAEQVMLFGFNGAQLVGHQIYTNHLPKDFSWHQAEQEMFPYRADISRGDLAVAFANALINQGVTSLVVPFDGAELVKQALIDAGLDTVLTLLDDPEAEPGERALSEEEIAAEADEEPLEDADDLKVAEDDAEVAEDLKAAEAFYDKMAADAFEELTESPGVTIAFSNDTQTLEYAPSELVILIIDGQARSCSAKRALEVIQECAADVTVDLVIDTDTRMRVTSVSQRSHVVESKV